MALCLIWMSVPLVLFVSFSMAGMAQFGQEWTSNVRHERRLWASYASSKLPLMEELGAGYCLLSGRWQYLRQKRELLQADGIDLLPQ